MAAIQEGRTSLDIRATPGPDLEDVLALPEGAIKAGQTAGVQTGKADRSPAVLASAGTSAEQQKRTGPGAGSQKEAGAGAAAEAERSQRKGTKAAAKAAAVAARLEASRLLGDEMETQPQQPVKAVGEAIAANRGKKSSVAAAESLLLAGNAAADVAQAPAKQIPSVKKAVEKAALEEELLSELIAGRKEEEEQQEDAEGSVLERASGQQGAADSEGGAGATAGAKVGTEVIKDQSSVKGTTPGQNLGEWEDELPSATGECCDHNLFVPSYVAQSINALQLQSVMATHQ